MPYNQSFFCKVDSNSQITLGNIPKKSWLMQFVLTSVAKSANFKYLTTKVIYPKYSKHWPYTVAHTIDLCAVKC